MKIDNDLRQGAILAELGRRLKEYRISVGNTQGELAEKAMISRKTLSRLENGEDVSAGVLFAVLSALKLGDNLELLIPDPDARPFYHLDERRKKRRVRHTVKPSAEKSVWKWGDEQ